MAPVKEKSLKRARPSKGEEESDLKKPRRSERISSQFNDEKAGTTYKNSQLPSPVTYGRSTSTDDAKDVIIDTTNGRSDHIRTHTPPTSLTPPLGLTSPPSDTQPFSQYRHLPKGLSHEVKDEVGEGVWGYLIPLDHVAGKDTLVLRQRAACPVPKGGGMRPQGNKRVRKQVWKEEEEKYEETKINGKAASGYLIGRHPECDRVIEMATVSNRHCLVFHENKGGDSVAVVEDLSGNGTFVNEGKIGRNKRRELNDGDEITILDQARFMFKYPRTRVTSGFSQQYLIQQQLGKGHFATVYLCVEKSSGMKFAVKKFEKRTGSGERSRVEGLQQEIAVLRGVSHPHVLCLKDTFDDPDGVYLVLELAVEGELFNWIVMKSKLTEAETRKIFIQLFQGVKYLHERNIVHRDIKPENILLVDKELSIKLADFGLAKIIGEESFTTTLCGTPSYVAPEILESSNHRRYTRAVDVWSLGVVLYICLCGFPPFSDELYSPENPYTLSQQILMGRFDYPSPYWDPVSDSALDLIDRMLTVNSDDRITIDEALEHPWVTQEKETKSAKDSAESLTGAMDQLDFSKRKPQRERTLLSTMNSVRVKKEVPIEPTDPTSETIRVYEKNNGDVVHPQAKNGAGQKGKEQQAKESKPDGERRPDDFIKMGGAGDQTLFGDDAGSHYI